MERLDKILASQGVGSRKECAALIRRGEVAVNGAAARRPEQKADPERDAIAAHMWPLTLRPPRHAVGWAVCLADKAAAGVEMLHLYRRLGVEQNVRSLADLRAASCAGRRKQ